MQNMALDPQFQRALFLIAGIPLAFAFVTAAALMFFMQRHFDD